MVTFIDNLLNAKIAYLLHLIGRIPVPGSGRLAFRFGSMISEYEDPWYEATLFNLKYKGRLDQFIDRYIYFTGSYAPLELAFLKTAAQKLKLEKERITCYDIGANVGQHSLYISQFADQVVAFEPQIEACEQFQANIELNDLRNIELFQFALGSTDCEMSLGTGFRGNMGSRSLRWTLNKEEDETVSVRNGDRIVESHKLPCIDLLKVDVEGFEKEVFVGLKTALARDRPVILFELIGNDEKSGFTDEASIRSNLYEKSALFTLSRDRRKPLLPFDWNEEAAICIPEERMDQWQDLCLS